MTTTDNERRRFTRVLFDGNCTLYTGPQETPLKITDISLKGVLAELKDLPQLSIGDKGVLIIELDGGDTYIEMPVTVNHFTEDHIAFSSGSMELDSIAHLRRLVELNLGNSELLERELENLVAN